MMHTREVYRGWKRGIGNKRLSDERSLRAWLTRQGVTGYAQSLLVMERFGYPDFVVASADQLIDRLQPSKIHESMRIQISMTAGKQVDSEVQKWLQQAYAENS